MPHQRHRPVTELVEFAKSRFIGAEAPGYFDKLSNRLTFSHKRRSLRIRFRIPQKGDAFVKVWPIEKPPFEGKFWGSRSNRARQQFKTGCHRSKGVTS